MYTFGSIKRKDTKKREVFLVNGDYKTREAFLEAFKRVLCDPEDYDFRTIRELDHCPNSYPHILMPSDMDVEAYDTYER